MKTVTLTKQRALGGFRLGTRVLFLVGGTTLILVLSLLVTSIFLYSRDKVTYIYDLQDLKTERLGDSLRRVLEREVSLQSRKDDATKKLGLDANPLDNGLPRLPELGEIFVGEHENRPLLVFKDSAGVRTATLEGLSDVFSKLEGVQALCGGEKIYWLTSFGNLLASTHKIEGSRAELAKRPAVSMFLRNSLTKGLVTVIDEKNNLVAGFKEIPGTNTAVFIETPLADAMRPLRRFVAIAAFVSASIIIFGLLVSSLVFERMWRPMRAVRWFTEQIAEGNYKATVPYQRHDEIGELFGFLSTMAGGLESREKKIVESERQLRVTEASHARLASSIEAASVIQSQLIHDPKSLGTIPGLALSAKCLAAEKCSGDWFGFYFDSASSMLIGAVTDVTGHGVASALITGVTAGVTAATTTMFELMRAKQTATFSPAERLCFLHATLDGAIKSCGQTKILASAFLFCFDCSSRTFFYLNAGHPSAFLFRSTEKSRTEFLKSHTDLLGFETVLDPVHVKSTVLGKGDSIVIYTDGLLEATDGGNAMGMKRLAAALAKLARNDDASADDLAKLALTEKEKLKQSLQDDVTVVALRVC